MLPKSKPTPLKVSGWYFPVEIDPTWTEAARLGELLGQLPRPLWISVYDSANVGPEALAAGLPLASTEQGVSGLDLVEGLDYLGGQSADDLADAVVRLLQCPEAAAPMGEAGRAYVRRAHDWSVAASQLEQVYATLVPLSQREAACV